MTFVSTDVAPRNPNVVENTNEFRQPSDHVTTPSSIALPPKGIVRNAPPTSLRNNKRFKVTPVPSSSAADTVDLDGDAAFLPTSLVSLLLVWKNLLRAQLLHH